MTSSSDNKPSPASRPQLSRKRRLLFSGLIALLLLLVIEGGSCLAYRVLVGESFSYGGVAKRAERASHLRVGDEQRPTAEDQKYYPDEVIHPFLGFIRKPPDEGACGRLSLIPPPRDKQLVVLILGGSVAQNFSEGKGLARLRELVAQAKPLAGRQVVFVVGARYGYKQPQQLNCVTYLMSQGARIDAVLNLDGINEVAADKVTNERSGVYPIYPTSWAARVRNYKERGAITRLARVMDLRRKRKARAAWFSTSLLRASVTANMLWALSDKRLAAQIKQAEYTLQTYTPEGAGYVVTGPGRKDLSAEQVDALLATIWTNTSLMLHQIARSNGMAYVHFLQPSQYVEGAKPLSADERARAYAEGGPHQLAVKARYPLLLANAKRLEAEGVRFVSLHEIFAKVQQPVFVDTCCHMNQLGHRKMAEAMAPPLIEALSKDVRR